MTSSATIVSALQNIQAQLKAPKGQFNKFGKYKYRSCEDIMEALKPLLNANNCALVVIDSMEQLGDRYYIKAEAKLMCEDAQITASAYAREPISKKGMDESQITGAASSYARKYALNGLFCIDDTVDADGDNDHKGDPPAKATDYKTMARELWKELAAKKNDALDQAVKRAVHANKDNDQGLYLALTEIINQENQG